MSGGRDRVCPRVRIRGKAAEREVRSGLRCEADREFIRSIGVAADEAECDRRVCVQGIRALAKGYQQAPLFDDQTAGHIERGQARPNTNAAPTAVNTRPHAGQGKPSPWRHVAGIRDRNDARHRQDHEDARREKREAKRRQAASALADLQTIRGLVVKRTSHTLSIGSSVQTPDRAMESNASWARKQ